MPSQSGTPTLGHYVPGSSFSPGSTEIYWDTAPFGDGDSYYVSVSGMGFTIPSGSVINGIVASYDVYKLEGDVTSVQEETEVNLFVSNHSPTSSNSLNTYADGPNTYIHGGTNDLWGMSSVSDDDINTSYVGFYTQSMHTSGDAGGGGWANLAFSDWSMTVYYSDGTGDAVMDPETGSGYLSFMTISRAAESGNLTFFTSGSFVTVSGELPLFARGGSTSETGLPFTTLGHVEENDSLPFFLASTDEGTGELPLFLYSSATESGEFPMVTQGGVFGNQGIPFFIKTTDPTSGQANLSFYMDGGDTGVQTLGAATSFFLKGGANTSELPFFVSAPNLGEKNSSLPLFVNGEYERKAKGITFFLKSDGEESSIPFFVGGDAVTEGWNLTAHSLPFFLDRPTAGSLPFFVRGPGTFAESGVSFYMNSNEVETDSIPLFVSGAGVNTSSLSLYTHGT